jgi:hypothetical protein
MGGNEIGSETSKAVKGGTKAHPAGKHNSSSANAKAALEKDNEKLRAALSTYKFLTIVGATVAFDAYVFTFFNTWASPICLVAIEFAGLFVLARYLEIDEFIYLTIDLMRSYAKNGKPSKADDEPE